MDIYVFDKSLSFIGIIDAFTSLQWNRKYYTCGDFELVCDVTIDNLNLLAKGNIIWKQGDSEAGVVNYRNLKQDAEGKEILDIKGSFITSYLKQRIVWNTINMIDTVENTMRTLVNQNCINPTDTNRIIPNLSLEAIKGLTYSSNYNQASNANLNDEIENLSTLSDLGHRILFDTVNKKLIFDVYAGVDRSVNQNLISPCIFSKEFENVLEQEYTDSSDNIKNACKINGKYTYQITTSKTVTNDDGTTTTTTTSTDATEDISTSAGVTVGVDRYEIALDSNSSSAIDTGTKDSSGNDTKIYLSQNNFMGVLVSDGVTELAKYVEAETFDSTINLYSNITYKVDFDLGDIVTCTSKKWGITLDTRVTEIQEVYEEQGLQINVTFGNAVPTLIQKIKQKIK